MRAFIPNYILLCHMSGTTLQAELQQFSTLPWALASSKTWWVSHFLHTNMKRVYPNDYNHEKTDRHFVSAKIPTFRYSEGPKSTDYAIEDLPPPPCQEGYLEWFVDFEREWWLFWGWLLRPCCLQLWLRRHWLLLLRIGRNMIDLWQQLLFHRKFHNIPSIES